MVSEAGSLAPDRDARAADRQADGARGAYLCTRFATPAAYPPVTARLWALILAGWAALAAGPLCAQPAPPAAQSGGGIYTCLDDKGRRLSSDRPIPECGQREQRMLNRDGSLKMVVPPVPTAEERLEAEAQARRQAEARAALADGVRRDRNLMLRYPDEAAHRRARDAALDVARSAARLGEERLNQLTEERRPLERELEFYQGKPVPPKLLSQMEAIDTAARAQKVVAQTQKAEIDRVQQMYDAELVHLKGLWSGQIAPGTPMAASAPARPAASAAATGRPWP